MLGFSTAALSLVIAVSTLDLSQGAAMAATYDNPAVYCAAVRTADNPMKDARYRGPAVTQSMKVAVGKSSAFGPIVWRCMHRRVFACVEQSTTACGKAPWLDRTQQRIPPGLAEECRRSPNEKMPGATHGTWTCSGTKPMLIGNQWPVDARGFYPPEWKIVHD